MTERLDLGRFHTLRVAQQVAGGVLLDGFGRELFLPKHLLPANAVVGDTLEVFVYSDGQGVPQATTHQPQAVRGEFACLRCVSVTRSGAYLAWGIPKDLYAPPDEQEKPMAVGRSYVVMIMLDKKGERLIASSRLAKHFDYDVEDILPDEEVDLLVYGHVDAGVQVVVDQRYRGLIHQSEVHRSLPVGVELRGYVHQIRHDNRLDIVLTRRGIDGIQEARELILNALHAAGGHLPLHDRSPPEAIKQALGISKKAFKRGVGSLYKAKQIELNDRGITLVKR